MNERYDPEAIGNFPIRQDITVLPPDDPKRLRIGWRCYEKIGVCVINDRCLHKYPKLIRGMQDFCPFRVIYRLCHEVHEPGVSYMKPRWLATIAGWTPLSKVSRGVWWLMGKPGAYEGIVINTIEMEKKNGPKNSK
jgi:hypothetical protein